MYLEISYNIFSKESPILYTVYKYKKYSVFPRQVHTI